MISSEENLIVSCRMQSVVTIKNKLGLFERTINDGRGGATTLTARDVVAVVENVWRGRHALLPTTESIADLLLVRNDIHSLIV